MALGGPHMLHFSIEAYIMPPSCIGSASGSPRGRSKRYLTARCILELLLGVREAESFPRAALCRGYMKSDMPSRHPEPSNFTLMHY